MNLTVLRVFVAVADHGSVSAAADALTYARSTVTDQVHKLEREVGVPLLGGNPVTLTPAGRAFLGHARTVLHAADQAVEAARDRHWERRPRAARAGGPAPYLLPLSG
jgi:LysR family nitrogen assimilation transcriptional regulator